MVFDSEGEDKSVTLMNLYEETEMECNIRQAPKIEMRDFITCLEELEGYNFIKMERNKRDHKFSTIQLGLELELLKKELGAIKESEEWPLL